MTNPIISTPTTAAAGAIPPAAHTPRLAARARSAIGEIALYITLTAFSLLSLAPFAWMICASFKRQDHLYAYTFLPWDRLNELTLDNYRILFRRQPFARWMANGLFLASLQTCLVVTFSSLGGFALAKYRLVGRKIIIAMMLSTMLLPFIALLPASYQLMHRLGWLNSYAAIIFPGAVSAFGMFLYMQAMTGVPDELLGAARIDGCSEPRLWWSIALPLVRPMTGAYTLLSFLAFWNAYLWPSIILQDESRYTPPIGLAGMSGLPQYESQYGVLMAGTFLAILPVVLLFFALQRDFISGLSSGAVKG